MTTQELLSMLPASYAEFNDTTVYNTNGSEHEGNDYSIELLEDSYEVRQTGLTQNFQTVEEVLDWISEE